MLFSATVAHLLQGRYIHIVFPSILVRAHTKEATVDGSLMPLDSIVEECITAPGCQEHVYIVPLK